MAIVPAGLPAWTRTGIHTQYGGDVNKRNILSQGVIDAQTDVGADEFARLAADLEAIVRTAPFAVITYACNDTSPNPPTIFTVFGMIGVNYTYYLGTSPPTGFPSAARNGNDDVTFTFASSYQDPYAVAGTFVPYHAIASCHGSSARIATVDLVSATTLRVRGFNDAGTAGTDNRFTLMVW
jgi:hypothetical protein